LVVAVVVAVQQEIFLVLLVVLAVVALVVLIWVMAQLVKGMLEELEIHLHFLAVEVELALKVVLVGQAGLE
jgi:hypothetical protein